MQWICLKTEEKKRRIDTNLNASLSKYIAAINLQMTPKVKFIINASFFIEIVGKIHRTNPHL